MIPSVLPENDSEVLHEEGRDLAVMKISSHSLAEGGVGDHRISSLILGIFSEGGSDRKGELRRVRILLISRKRNRRNHRLMW